MPAQPTRILVIRNDKLGDFMLAWPAFALLKQQYPDCRITALVPAYTEPMAELCEWIDDVLIDNKQSSFLKDILNLSRNIRKQKFDASISFFSEARTSISLWLAGVKSRIGPATKLAQIFLNRKLRQKRSRSLKPEFEYNMELARHFISLNGDDCSAEPSPPYLRFDDDTVCQIECSNNARLPAPRWYVIGTKGSFLVHGKKEPIWGQVEIYYEDEGGEETHERIELIDVCESGIEGGFYRDLVPFLNGEKETFVSMYEASRVVKILELIKKSSEEKRFIPFDE